MASTIWCVVQAVGTWSARHCVVAACPGWRPPRTRIYTGRVMADTLTSAPLLTCPDPVGVRRLDTSYASCKSFPRQICGRCRSCAALHAVVPATRACSVGTPWGAAARDRGGRRRLPLRHGHLVLGARRSRRPPPRRGAARRDQGSPAGQGGNGLRRRVRDAPALAASQERLECLSVRLVGRPDPPGCSDRPTWLAPFGSLGDVHGPQLVV